jgi:hypothetical protein
MSWLPGATSWQNSIRPPSSVISESLVGPHVQDAHGTLSRHATRPFSGDWLPNTGLLGWPRPYRE